MVFSRQLLFFGFFLLPFTSLRPGIFGLGEFFVLLSFFISFFNRLSLRIDRNLLIFYSFFTYFIGLSLLGFFYNYLFVSSPSGRLESAYFDILSYFFILLAIITVGNLFGKDILLAKSFFINLFLCWFLSYIFLYFYSFISPNIFGLSLFYFDNFSPLVDNIHQSASLTSALSFVAFYFAVKKKSFAYKIVYFFVASIFVFMSIDSGSTKALMGILLGCLLILISFCYNLFFLSINRIQRTILNFSIFLLVIFFIYFNVDYFYSLFFLFFSENDGGQARELIYITAFNHGLNSPVVGYGPGAHTYFDGQFWDAHSSLLTIFLQSGFLGVFVFLLFLYKFFNLIKMNIALSGAFVVIAVYALGGDILRRMPIWIVLLGLTYIVSHDAGRIRLRIS